MTRFMYALRRAWAEYKQHYFLVVADILILATVAAAVYYLVR